jgi:hypothetical protein
MELVQQKPVYTSSSETVEGMKRKRKSKNGRIKERQTGRKTNYIRYRRRKEPG